MKKLVHFITYSKAAAYIAALLCVVSWCVQVETKTLAGALWLLLSLVMGYLLIKVNREFSLSDSKNTLPATLFFMGSALVPDLLCQHGGGVHFILFSVSCFMLLRTYRSRDAMGVYFLAFALIGVQCLLSPPLLLTLPFVVLGGAFLESLHGRTLFAALWGLLFPYWMTCGVLFLTDRVGLIVPYFGQIISVSSVPVLTSFGLWAQLLWTLLLIVLGCIGVLLNHTMKLQAGAVFRLIITVLLVLTVAIGVYPANYSALFPCVLLGASLIGPVLFWGSEKRARNIFLIALVLVGLSSLGYVLYGTIL
jgi:hypothetical protein